MKCNVRINSAKLLNRYKYAPRQIAIAQYRALADISSDTAKSIKKTIQNPLKLNGQHIPSKPGEPPRSRTGALRRSIRSVVLNIRDAVVSANAKYAKYLERGTKNMQKRPFFYKGAYNVLNKWNATATVRKRLFYYLNNIK